MKLTFLSVFRAMVFAICIFLLATVGGYEIKTGKSVAVFLISITVGWMVLEKVLTSVLYRKKPKPRPY